MSKMLAEGFKAEKRPLRERRVIWASEVGKAYFDRFHKMNGVPSPVELSARTYFKFFVGDAIEYSLCKIFERAGMTVERQKGKEKCRVIVDGCYPVEGKYDAILSATGEWEEAMLNIKQNPLPEEESFIDRYAFSLAGYCRDNFPDGFSEELFEIKTINSMMLKSRMKSGTMVQDYYHYHLQLYTYMKALGLSRGNIFYISKDDGIFYIETVKATKKLEEDWLADIRGITECVENGQEPEFPPAYYLKNGKYVVNWSAVGSEYLSLIGVNPEEYQDEVQKKVRQLNYQLKKETKI